MLLDVGPQRSRNEPGASGALQAFLSTLGRLATSRVGEVEARRAVERRGAHVAQRLDDVLAGLTVVELDASLARRAAAVPPPSLRTLDAIHLATAAELANELGVFVTYDRRLAEAALGLGLRVESPA